MAIYIVRKSIYLIIKTMKSVSQIVEDLVQQQFPEQALETYSPQQFIQTLMNLHSKSILFYCPYDEATLKEFYHQIADQQQTEVLSYETVIQFISKMKQINQQNLVKQIEFYQREIKEILQKNIRVISRKEFRKMTDRFQSDRQLITQVMIENIQNSNYVSCEKMLAFIEEIKNEIEKPLTLGVTVSTFKNCKLHLNQRDFAYNSSRIENFDQITKSSNILEGLSQHPIKVLLNHYMESWHRKLTFYREFVSDEQILQDMDKLNQQALIKQKRINDEVNSFADYMRDLQRKEHQFEDIYQTIKEQQKLEQVIIEKQQHHIAELKDQLSKSEIQKERQVAENQILRQNLEITKKNIIKLATEYEEIEKDFNTSQQNYRQLYSEYNKLITSKTQSNEMQTKLQEYKIKITIETTFKKKLTESVQKLQKMMSTKETKLKQFCEKEEMHVNTITNLQQKLEELQKELKQKRQYLNISMRASKYLDNEKNWRKMQRQSLYQNNWTKEVINDETKFRKTINPFPELIKQSKLKLGVAQVISQMQESVYRNQFLSKRLILKIIQQDNNVYNKSNTFNIFSSKKQLQDDQIGNNSKNYNAKQLNKSQSIQLISLHNQEKLSNNCFISKGILISDEGNKFETITLLTPKRFCYFDVDIKVPHFVLLSNIKSITFCYHNPNLFVIRLKKLQRLSQKQFIAQDMIFSLRQRSKLVTFLSKKFVDTLLEHQIKILFKREEDIFVIINRKQRNLKVSVPGIIHPLRLCISGQPVFYGNILQQDKILNFHKNCCFIIEPMGILCFQGDQTQQIGKRHLLYILPLIENMKIQRENCEEGRQKQLHIEYQDDEKWKKSYKLIFSSKQGAQQFMITAQTQKRKNYESKATLFNAQSKLFDALQRFPPSPKH